MTFDKNYYNQKLIDLNMRLQTKKTQALNEILAVLQRYMKDEKEIITDSAEIQKRMEEAKKKNEVEVKVILDKNGNPISSPIKKEEKVEAPKEGKKE